MTRTIIAGNWKMNMTAAEARGLVAAMLPGLKEVEDVEPVVCPPFVALEAVGGLLRSTGVALAAQNLHHETRAPLRARSRGPCSASCATS